VARTGPFDDHSLRYEEWFLNHPYVYQSELEAVRHFLPLNGGGLEVGVGSGRFAEPLEIRTGVEPSAAMRGLAKSRGIEVYDAPAEALPFPDERFDFVIMVTTICFVDDIDASFREVKRVLKKGGLFVVGFVDKESPLGKTYAAHQSENLFYRDATFYSTAEALSFLRSNGFLEPQAIQTLFGDLGDIRAVQPWKEGNGEGGFVVIRSRKS